MIIKFRDRFKREREEGSSLIFAILVVMMMLLATVIVATTATAGAITARELSSTDILRSSAQAALENALLNANKTGEASYLESHRGPALAVSGKYTAESSIGRQDEEIRWKWYTEQVVFPGELVGYYVYAIGYSQIIGEDKGVKLRAQFKPTSVSTATYKGGKLQYKLSAESAFQWGITGTEKVEVKSGAKIFASDSFYGPMPSGGSVTGTTIATNQTVVVQSGSGVQEANFTSPPATGESCTGTGCDALGKVYREFDINLEEIGASQREGGVCDGQSPTIWKASENDGILNLPTRSCVSSLIFDVDTTVPANYSASSPLIVYVGANITVNKGVSVNKTNSPSALKLYSESGNFGSDGQTNTTEVRVNAYIASEKGTCTTYAKLKFFGALSCGETVIEPASIVYLDLASRGRNGRILGSNIWTMYYVEEL